MRRAPVARRLARRPSDAQAASIMMGHYHPAQAEPPVIPNYMPLTMVYVSPAGLIVSDTHPMYTADPTRAPIPMTGPGQWGQVRAAGRP